MGKVSAKKYLNFKSQVRIYVIANRAQAKFYRQLNSKKIVLIERLINPQGKLLEKQLKSDRPGRSFSSFRSGNLKHSLGKQDSQEIVGRRFAKVIGGTLDRLRKSEKVDEVILAAEPKFLGFLKRAVTKSSRALIIREIDKEFPKGEKVSISRFIKNNEDVFSKTGVV